MCNCSTQHYVPLVECCSIYAVSIIVFLHGQLLHPALCSTYRVLSHLCGKYISVPTCTIVPPSPMFHLVSAVPSIQQVYLFSYMCNYFTQPYVPLGECFSICAVSLFVFLHVKLFHTALCSTRRVLSHLCSKYICVPTCAVIPSSTMYHL